MGSREFEWQKKTIETWFELIVEMVQWHTENYKRGLLEQSCKSESLREMNSLIEFCKSYVIFFKYCYFNFLVDFLKKIT